MANNGFKQKKVCKLVYLKIAYEISETSSFDVVVVCDDLYVNFELQI